MPHSYLDKLDVLQRKMLRRLVGWTRIDDVSWRDTMRRMNIKLHRAQDLFYCQSWKIGFARSQWRYISHILHAHPLLWARRLCKFNFNPVTDPVRLYLPHRSQGRPKMHWDDHVKDFLWQTYPHHHGRHWFDICADLHFEILSLEDAYVAYITGAV